MSRTFIDLADMHSKRLVDCGEVYKLCSMVTLWPFACCHCLFLLTDLLSNQVKANKKEGHSLEKQKVEMESLSR